LTVWLKFGMAATYNSPSCSWLNLGFELFI